MIEPNHPVREAFADCSTCNADVSYYDSKAEAVATFNAVLMDYDYHLVSVTCLLGDSGHWTIDICNDDSEVVGQAYFSWNQVCSGKWYIVGYIL